MVRRPRRVGAPRRRRRRMHRVSLRSVFAGIGVVLVAVALGIGGHFGRGSGEDLDAARVAGQTAGEKAGTARHYAGIQGRI